MIAVLVLLTLVGFCVSIMVLCLGCINYSIRHWKALGGINELPSIVLAAALEVASFLIAKDIISVLVA